MLGFCYAVPEREGKDRLRHRLGLCRLSAASEALTRAPSGTPSEALAKAPSETLSAAPSPAPFLTGAARWLQLHPALDIVFFIRVPPGI